MDNVFMLWNGIGPYIGGTVPACLFNASAFPLLTNLYLAGNGFTGYIPNVVQPTAALKNVSLGKMLSVWSPPSLYIPVHSVVTFNIDVQY